MPNVGEMVTVTTLVPTFDGTTAASLTVTTPDGDEEHPVATTPDSGNTWNAPVEYSQAGVWVFKWVITGTGAKTEYSQAAVAPSPLEVPPGPQYATSADLAAWLGTAPPVGADRLLVQASRAINDALLTAVYPIDDAGNPTDAAQIQALRNATCAVVEWWLETGDELGASGDWQSASAGDVSISKSTTGTTTQVSTSSLPARAWGELTRSGLLPGTVFQL